VLLKKIGYSAVKIYKKKFSPKNDWLCHLHKANAIYQEIVKSSPQIDKVKNICKRTPKLLEIVSTTPFGSKEQIEKVNSFIEDIYKTNGTPIDTTRSENGSYHSKRLSELKAVLPFSRRRLTKIVHNGQIKTTNEEIAPVARECYEKIWSQRSESKSARTKSARVKLLDKYTAHLAPNVSPKMLKVSHIEKAILGAGKSSAGVDGVSHTFYKKLVDIAKKIFFEIFVKLAMGLSTSEQLEIFNSGLLYLLPKNESGDIEDTRPVNVNNWENRIIAKAVTDAIMKAADSIIHPSQNGFVKGRLMTDNLHKLSKKLYDSKKLRFFLFLDTKKAFDSIDHDFLLLVLEKQGWPEWFCRLVTALLSSSSANLAMYDTLPISILRGVKQGCPLSPILFVLAYDVLLRYLADIVLTKAMGAADDVIIYDFDLRKIIEACKAVDLFSQATGLGINRKKTKLLSAKKQTLADSELVAEGPWPKIEFVTSYKYLGILFGQRNKLWIEQIYTAPLTKALRRLSSYRGVLSRLDLDDRILTVNTFITPILIYTSQFYIMPPNIFNAYQKAVARTIIPWAAKACTYILLIGEKAGISPAIPLLDIWALSRKVLISKFDFSRVYDPERKKLREKDVSIFSTSNFAAFEYLEKMTVDRQIPDPKSPSLYSEILSAGYEQKWDEELQRKITRFEKYSNGVPVDAETLNRNTKLAKNPPSHHKANHFKLVCNANATDLRNGWRKPKPRSANPANQFPCLLCQGKEDRIEHYYGSCPSATQALDRLHSVVKFNTVQKVLTSPSPWYLLQFETLNSEPLGVSFLLAFFWALWTVVTRLRKGLLVTSPIDDIVDITLTQKRFWAPKKIQESKKHIELFQLEFDKVNPEDIVAFTDGSANPNPGPCGAGACILGNTEKTTLVAALGQGTNNIGELWAIGMTINHVLFELNSGKIVHLFTDSLYSRGVLTLGWKPKKT
jgi:hypothetical protein